MRKRPFFGISLILLTLCLAVPAFAAGTPKEPMGSFVLAMSTDNAKVFDGAIAIGTVALKRGHPVNMLLRLDSIKVAVAQNTYPAGKTTLGRELTAFMKKGAKVFVGGKCVKQMGLKPQDFLPGVRIGTPDVVMGMIFEKDAKILTY